MFLILAGVFEIGFTTCLKLSDGFSQKAYTFGFLLFATLSFYFLNKSIATIPLGTAYAVWTGIGAVGTVAVGVFAFNEPINAVRMVLLFVLIMSIVGLKFAQ